MSTTSARTSRDGSENGDSSSTASLSSSCTSDPATSSAGRDEALQGRKTAGKDPRPSSSTGTTVLTRKRRLIQQTEADLAIGIAPYWEAATVIADQGTDDIRTADHEPSQKSGTRRRSRRGEARQIYEGAAGVRRVHEKMAVNLPPMVITREGKLLAVEVFGDAVRKRLPAADKGPRVGHCSSGYVCGHPVPRGKEGNKWCQTPVRPSLASKMTCVHHQRSRVGNAGHTVDQQRFLLLADEFYNGKGELCWLRVVGHLRSLAPPLEISQRKLVITAGGRRALAVADVKIALHGFKQCTMFWLAACRLTRRGYSFSMVAHPSKADFRDFVTELHDDKTILPPPKPSSSPLVCISDLNNSGAWYYASGYDDVCRML